MTDSPLEEIKSRLNIVDVVADYLQLKKAGVNFRARCPFHNEKTPSFYVSPVRQIWHCFGCGLGGDMFEFVKQIEAVDFPEALKKLASKAGVALVNRSQGGREERDRKEVLYEINALAAAFYHRVLLDSPLAEQARQYLRKRNFQAPTLAAWQIGYAPDRQTVVYEFLKKRGFTDQEIELSGLAFSKEAGGHLDRFRDRVMFPILDAGGRAVGFSARLLVPKEGVGKYINSPESPIYSKSDVLFGLYQAKGAIRRENLAVIVEGNIDVIKSHQAGIANVVGSSGTALTERQLGRLSRLCENLTFSFDADQAGVKAADRALSPALKAGFNLRLVILPKGCKDADEVIDRDQNLWKRAIAEASEYLDFYFHQLFDILDTNSAQEKKTAVEKYLALLANVSSPIVIAHYLHKVASAVGAKDQVVIDQFKRLPKREILTPSAQAASPASGMSADERMEQRFVGLVLRDLPGAGAYLSRHPSEHFTNFIFRELITHLEKFLRNDQSGKLEGFFQANKQLQTAGELAIFTVEAFASDALESKAELAELSKRLTLAYYDRVKRELTVQIAAAEEQHRHSEKEALAFRFNELVQKIQEEEKRET